MSSTGVAPSNARMAISVALGLHETRRDRAQIFQRGTRCELLHTFDEVGIMTEMLMIRRVRERVEHGRANVFVVLVVGHNPPPDRGECRRIEYVQPGRAQRPDVAGLRLVPE